MGFKAMSKDKSVNEEQFLNSARGETTIQRPVGRKKQDTPKRKPFAIYLNDEELKRVQDLASKKGMNLSQYLRFKALETE